MDSKFGPDGALYVQVYDGFFRAEPDAGMWRFNYTGGPDTPGAAPEAFPIGGFEVSFTKRAARAASPTRGTSATARRSRPRRTRPTPTPRPGRTRPR